MIRLFRTVIFFSVLFALALTVSAQTKASKKPKKVKKTMPTASTQTTSETPVEVPVKRNERPLDTDAAGINGEKKETPQAPTVNGYTPVYFYEFNRPGFTYSQIVIEHDEAGKGKISFLKEGFGEMITDPIELSPVTLTKIKDALTALNFLDSTENYQHTRDYSNLGNISFSVKQKGRERTVKFNWTDNKNARILMDEYRRIGNEYTWRFEITTARENYPLQAPGQMDTLDGYLKRNEISDPQHLLPILTTLSTDERIPLMARNRAAKLVKQIEKEKK